MRFEVKVGREIDSGLDVSFVDEPKFPWRIFVGSAVVSATLASSITYAAITGDFSKAAAVAQAMLPQGSVLIDRCK